MGGKEKKTTKTQKNSKPKTSNQEKEQKHNLKTLEQILGLI